MSLRLRPLLPDRGITRTGATGDGVTMSETVLVVDDQEIVRDVIRLALEAAGYTVIAASSPSHAIELARDDANIDLLVTDVVMPEIGAFELADRITSKLPGLCILFTSGYADAGAEGPFIHKPFTPAQLVAKVETVLAP